MRLHLTDSSKSILFIALSISLIEASVPDIDLTERWLGHIGLGTLLTLILVILALTLLSALFAWRISNDISCPDELTLELNASGEERYTSFELPSYTLASMIFRVDYSWDAPSFINANLRGGREYCYGLNRGYLDKLQRRVVLSDGLGLVRFMITGPPISAAIKVNPHRLSYADRLDLRSVGGGADLSAQGARDGDFTDYRVYQTGDSLHRVLWKLSDRLPNDELLVRQQEMTANQRCGVFLLLDGHDHASAAMLAYNADQLCQEGLVFIASSCDNELYCFERREELMDFLVHRTHIEDKVSGWTYKDFLEACRNRGISMTYILTGHQGVRDRLLAHPISMPYPHALNIKCITFSDESKSTVSLG
jgi:hypothetical protein